MLWTLFMEHLNGFPCLTLLVLVVMSVVAWLVCRVDTTDYDDKESRQ
jgi:hypothetical protein